MLSKTLYYTVCTAAVVIAVATAATSLTMAYKTYNLVKSVEMTQSRTTNIGIPSDEQIRAWMQDCGAKRRQSIAEGRAAKPCG